MDNNLIKLNEEYSMTYEYVIKNYDMDIDVKNSQNKFSNGRSCFHWVLNNQNLLLPV